MRSAEETPTDDLNEFDVTVNTLLAAVDAEKYTHLFESKDLGQLALTQLSDEDLIKIGVDDGNIRRKILTAAKSLPIYEETSLQSDPVNLGPSDVVEVLEESSQHLYRIYLSLMANSLAIKKSKDVTDYLLTKDKYASEIALSTLSEINNIMNSMDIALHTQLKTLTRHSKNTKRKKLIVGTIGSAVIAFLAVLFTRSIKQLKE